MSCEFFMLGNFSQSILGLGDDVFLGLFELSNAAGGPNQFLFGFGEQGPKLAVSWALAVQFVDQQRGLEVPDDVLARLYLGQYGRGLDQLGDAVESLGAFGLEPIAVYDVQ